MVSQERKPLIFGLVYFNQPNFEKIFSYFREFMNVLDTINPIYDHVLDIINPDNELRKIDHLLIAGDDEINLINFVSMHNKIFYDNKGDIKIHYFSSIIFGCPFRVVKRFSHFVANNTGATILELNTNPRQTVVYKGNQTIGKNLNMEIVLDYKNTNYTAIAIDSLGMVFTYCLWDTTSSDKISFDHSLITRIFLKSFFEKVKTNNDENNTNEDDGEVFAFVSK